MRKTAATGRIARRAACAILAAASLAAGARAVATAPAAPKTSVTQIDVTSDSPYAGKFEQVMYYFDDHMRGDILSRVYNPPAPQAPVVKFDTVKALREEREFRARTLSGAANASQAESVYAPPAAPLGLPAAEDANPLLRSPATPETPY